MLKFLPRDFFCSAAACPKRKGLVSLWPSWSVFDRRTVILKPSSVSFEVGNVDDHSFIRPLSARLGKHP
jgi:hypothetical protein